MRAVRSADDVVRILEALDALFSSGMPDRRVRRVLAKDLDALVSADSELVRALVASDNVEIALAVHAFGTEGETLATWHTEAARLKEAR